MSAPGSHIVGKLVKKALTLSTHRVKSGPWEVVVTGHNLGGTYNKVWAHMTMHHYGTKMLEWNYYPSANRVEMLGTWTGIGSVSDQTGVNSALMALGVSMRYSRVGVTQGRHRTVVDPSAARINPPTYYQAVSLLRKIGMSLTKREGEYRVAFRGSGNEHTAYYTTDLTDAMQTGLDMARRAGLSGALVRRNPVAGEIPGDVEKIFYQRHGNTKHPGPYQHKFGRGAKMIALKNGDVVIRSVRGKKLWGRY